MITVTEASAYIQANLLSLPVVEVPLAEAVRKVLREPIYADRDFPPYHRVTMDGIALRLQAYQAGVDTFRIAGGQLAGAPPQTLTHAAGCLEVMTGAVLPHRTDTVIRYEDIEISERQEGRYARIIVAPTMRRQNVHQQGSDCRAGALLIPAGTLLSPAEIAVAATVGQATLPVTQAPRIAIISTGDELVDVAATPFPHQIRKSNSYMLQAALREHNTATELFHLRDDKAFLLAELENILGRFDGLLISGGVSKGKADFIPEVLQELGVQKVFHEVAQRPGKPFWFGRVPQGPVVFALPGNPVSTFVCYYKYVQPWLRASLGAPAALPTQAILQAKLLFNPSLTYFVPVKLSLATNGAWLAQPLPNGGSGDLAALLAADGLLELPAELTVFPAGQVFPLIGFRQ